MSIVDRAGRWLVVVGLVAAAAPLATPAPATASGRALPVIYDSDMDFDDASTLAYLCEEHKLGHIDLRAVTVANDGFGVPGRSRAHAHSILNRCGLPHVPVADGSTDAGVHPAPPELVSTIETVLTGALDDAGFTPPPARLTAAEQIARAARDSRRPVTVLATGPMTNVAAALARPGVAGRIDRVHLMGGALAVPGNLYGSALPGFDNSQEFNFWMDPVSARRMLALARPGSVHVVPLDATRFVPITQEYVARLAADRHAPGARIAYAIASQPDLAALIDLGIMYWWDALAATSLIRPGLTTVTPTKIKIVLDGVQSGRTVETPAGYPVRTARDADRERFERTFLDALNGRA